MWHHEESCREIFAVQSDVRLSEDVEHGDTLGRLRRVQVVQCRHGVDDAKHHSCFQPVINQVGISQTSCKGTQIHLLRDTLMLI